MLIRDIVQIDEEKCDGCGLCVPSCEEGAIQILDGKARVVSETYCDGLGACLGHCPRGAISIVQREAPPFDLQAVASHLAGDGRAEQGWPTTSLGNCPGTACPGTASQQLELPADATSAPLAARSSAKGPSRLANWPVQLHLVSPQSPLLQRADLLLVADCVPFACADFHSRILDGRPVVIGCPKLDDCHAHVNKLAAVLQQARIRSITVVRMEVPCCTGLLRIVEAAMRMSGVRVPLGETVVTTRGEIVEGNHQQPFAAGASRTVGMAGQLPIL